MQKFMGKPISDHAKMSVPLENNQKSSNLERFWPISPNLLRRKSTIIFVGFP